MIVTKANIKEIDFLNGATIFIDKPLGFTSFQIVNGIRKKISKYINSKIKIGHAGTLDPLATGMLILCTGKDTKIIDSYQAQSKLYSGSFYIGATRPSYDKETEIESTYDISEIDENQILSVANSFMGTQMITPPAHSAIKVNGVRAYKMARKGIEVEIKAKEIEIYKFAIEAIKLPLIYFSIGCTKGTYIRSIAYEFGHRLSNGAYLESLRREQIGEYSVDNAWQYEKFIECIDDLTQRSISSSVIDTNNL